MGFKRDYVARKVIDLHEKKGYRHDTLFVAMGILDRYVMIVGAKNIMNSQLAALATISVLLAAKFEQPVSPSYLRMIQLLTLDEQKLVTK